MPIQKYFRLNRSYKTNRDLLTGKRFIDVLNRVVSTGKMPSNSTNVSISITYKGQLLHGNLLQASTDLQEIGEQEIFESANANINVNINPVKSISISIAYSVGQININSNNFSTEEFDDIVRLFEQIFPVSQELIPQVQVQVQTENGQVASKKEQLNRQIDSKTVFVIMSFNDDHRDSYFVAIQPTLRKLGFEPIRVDEIQHNNTVTKEIYEAIDKSAFVVADLTGERPNVYYEVGWAHKAEKEVVMLAKRGTAVHFDVAAINRIDYKDYTDLCDALEKRVKAVAERLGYSINAAE